jgi:hypothetical protein
MAEPETVSEHDLRLLAIDQAAKLLPHIPNLTADDAMSLVDRVLAFIKAREEEGA